eukprot:GHVR01084042.1.p1 GENE.GHVR01084042.1~~GHVR01084042.1.p1  ORF type:complete len:168 (+),score=22.18 GHVR01084042.1:628-1131(+)
MYIYEYMYNLGVLLTVQVPTALPCNHQPNYPCSTINSGRTLSCYFKVDVVLPCGHMKKNVRCSERNSTFTCTHKEKVIGNCGHECIVICKTKEPCKKPCDYLLLCGHKCLKQCSTCKHDDGLPPQECTICIRNKRYMKVKHTHTHKQPQTTTHVHTQRIFREKHPPN